MRDVKFIFTYALYITVSLITTNNIDNIINKRELRMKRIEFIPKEFHKAELRNENGRGINTDKNLCTPGYPDFPWFFNEILLNSPEKIIYHINIDTAVKEEFKYIFPICCYLSISSKQGLKYHHLDFLIHIKKRDTPHWYSGVVKQRPFPGAISDTNTIEQQDNLERRIKEAQKYSDEELNSGSGSSEIRNFNLLDFITFPITSGEYEVYFSAKGLESKHRFIDIIVDSTVYTNVKSEEPYSPMLDVSFFGDM